MKFVETLGYKVFLDDLSKIKFDDSPCVINTISLNSYDMATKNLEFTKDKNFQIIKAINTLQLDILFEIAT